MPTLQGLVALSAAALIAAPLGALAASPPAKADEHAAHHPEASASAPKAAMEDQIKAMGEMREMRDKMMNAKTPEERQALMADHMKAMQDGMQMMKGMSGMSGMEAMGGTGGMAGMADKAGKPTMGPKAGGKGMPADMAQHHQMMEERMDMMQMMMEMMMQRMPADTAAGK